MSNAASRRRGRLAGAVVPVIVAMAVGAFAISGPARAATASTRPLLGTHPRWATAAAGRGATPAATTVSAQVYLAGRDPSALAAYARAVSTPTNAEYRHYLTPAQQAAAFGPTSTQLRKVDSWLTGAGLRISGTTEPFVSVPGQAAAAGRPTSACRRAPPTGGSRRPPSYRTPTGTPLRCRCAAMRPTSSATLTGSRRPA